MEQERSHRARLLAILVSLLGACLAVLAACGTTVSAGGSGQPGASGTPVAYDAHPGQILVQLFPSPGFIFPQVNGVPSWTLYGDGTLVFANGADANGAKRLFEAKLTPDQVQQILNTVVNQNAFFASDKQTYGRMVPDTGSTLLTVNAQGRSKTVTLYGGEGSQPDTQTKHVFAIETYLQGYHPANIQPYTPQGVALLVYPASEAQNTLAVGNWPYSTIDLAQTEAEECPYLQANANCPQHMTGQSGILPIYGPSGTNLLRQLGPQAPVAQNGVTYLVVIWPLMPDVPPPNIHPTSSVNPPPHIRVASGGQIQEWPLMNMNGVPTGA